MKMGSPSSRPRILPLDQALAWPEPRTQERPCPRQALTRLELSPGRLPFAAADLTAGAENELQAAVLGQSEQVDLPLVIRESSYYANVKKRLARGELPRRALSQLDAYLEENPAQVWENSWVRLPLASLGQAAAQALENDLLADKSQPQMGRRSDWAKFFTQGEQGRMLRAPVSYLLKLALVQALDREGLPGLLAATGRRLQGHFLSDNTSPETFSFHVIASGKVSKVGKVGMSLAGETAKRFLLSHLLLLHAGQAFELARHGQHPLVYFAPHPPWRQKRLNACIPDTFYRELFMSPCLAGWDRGEDKHRYMHLCHQVLSRSHLNALAKLKEAGIIQNNLVVLPQTSNISLANNGTHISLGSRLLGRALADPASGFGPAQEKSLGDLVIKFVEHFLPLFVGSYSAAPYRLDFKDFHPENVLGFLPHELDYTHLRMIWRRWKKKAKLKALGVRLTPFGPPWLDRLAAGLLRLKGDLVPDFRLVDYLAAPLSTDQAPALDGRLGNQERLKRQLAQAGVFDESMATYLLYRQRQQAAMGYSGFEGRHYSLFPSLARDLAPATALQALLTALACRLIMEGRLNHDMIPDTPQVESERRQIFFAAALGVPTFYLHAQSGNHFLAGLASQTARARASRRYPHYLRLHNLEYRRALLMFLRREAGDLAQDLGQPDLLYDLAQRLENGQAASAHQALVKGVMEGLGPGDPLKVSAAQFNQAAEAYYRQELAQSHLAEGLEFLARDLASPEFRRAARHSDLGQALAWSLGEADPALAARQLGGELLRGGMPPQDVLRLLDLLLISLAHDAQEAAAALGREPEEKLAGLAASVH